MAGQERVSIIIEVARQCMKILWWTKEQRTTLFGLTLETLYATRVYYL